MEAVSIVEENARNAIAMDAINERHNIPMQPEV